MKATITVGLLAMAIATGACGDDETPVDPVAEAAAVGTYTLVSINGTPLPFKYAQSDTSRFDITEGRIVLSANHDMTDETTTTETRLTTGAQIGGEAVQRYLGTWSLRGDSIRLAYPGLGFAMAGRNGTGLVLAGQPSYAYSK